MKLLLGKSLKYAVIGAGNGGKAMAADMALLDLREFLYNRTPVLATFPVRPHFSREKHPRQSLNRLSLAINSKSLKTG